MNDVDTVMPHLPSPVQPQVLAAQSNIRPQFSEICIVF